MGKQGRLQSPRTTCRKPWGGTWPGGGGVSLKWGSSHHIHLGSCLRLPLGLWLSTPDVVS